MKTTATGIIAAIFLAIAAAAWAQNPPSTPAPAAPSTTAGQMPGSDANAANPFATGSDVSLGLSATFFRGTTAYGQTLTITNNLGWNLDFRHHVNDWFAADIRYGSGNNTFNFLPSWTEYAQTREIMANAVFILATDTAVQPFFEAGMGVLDFSPNSSSGNTSGASSQAKFALDLGGGADYDYGNHLGVRAEGRLINFDQPDFGKATINGFRLANRGLVFEPTLSVFYHF